MYAPLHKIIEAIGEPATMKLVEKFGGTRIYLPLPKSIDKENEIAKAIGVEAARTLACLWPQEQINIPTATRYRRAIVKSEVRRDRDSLTVSQLARKYETTERNVYRMLSEPDEPRK